MAKLPPFRRLSFHMHLYIFLIKIYGFHLRFHWNLSLRFALTVSQHKPVTSLWLHVLSNTNMSLSICWLLAAPRLRSRCKLSAVFLPIKRAQRSHREQICFFGATFVKRLADVYTYRFILLCTAQLVQYGVGHVRCWRGTRGRTRGRLHSLPVK